MANDESVCFGLDKVGRAGFRLKTEQEKAVHSVYNGKAVLVWLPNAGVVNLCAMICCRLCLIISKGSVVPRLVFLIIDQVSSLRQCNVPAASLNTCRGRDSAYTRIYIL